MKTLMIPLRDGKELAVRCLGHGKPVMLLHGFGSQSSHWLPNVMPLTRTHRFILPDLRGFGASHHVPFTDTDVFTTYANDMEDVLDHLHIDKVTLGGISTGAYACLVFNREGGFRRVERYLNIEHSAQSRNSPEWQHGLFGQRQSEIFDGFRGLLAAVENIDPETSYWDLPQPLRHTMRDTVGALFYRATNRRLTRKLIMLAAQYGEAFLTRHMIPVANWRIYLEVMKAFMEGLDTRDQLGNITVPTTLMIGTHSRFFSTAGQLDMCSYIPHAKVVRFENSGHIPMLDEPLKFQREFSNFLRAS